MQIYVSRREKEGREGGGWGAEKERYIAKDKEGAEVARVKES